MHGLSHSLSSAHSHTLAPSLSPSLPSSLPSSLSLCDKPNTLKHFKGVSSTFFLFLCFYLCLSPRNWLICPDISPRFSITSTEKQKLGFTASPISILNHFECAFPVSNFNLLSRFLGLFCRVSNCHKAQEIER